MTAVVALIVTAVLLLTGAVLREVEVPPTGALGRSPRARVITLAMLVSAATAAVSTLLRLLEMAA